MCRSISGIAVLDNKFIGKVNVDDRILSDKCELTVLEDDKYRLVQFDAELPSGKAFWETTQLLNNLINNWDKVEKKGIVTAEIDGKTYSGAEIIVDGKTVQVNNELTEAHTMHL